MSESFDLIRKRGIGYFCEDYGESNYLFSLNNILKTEMIELGNIEIPLYLKTHYSLDLTEFDLATDSFTKLVNKEYNWWLNKNQLLDGIKSLELFKQDCIFRNIQSNSFKIIINIKELILKLLKTHESNVKCCWLSESEIAKKKTAEIKEYKLPDQSKYICINDISEEGVLIAFID